MYLKESSNVWMRPQLLEKNLSKCTISVCSVSNEYLKSNLIKYELVRALSNISKQLIIQLV